MVFVAVHVLIRMGTEKVTNKFKKIIEAQFKTSYPNTLTVFTCV